MASIELNADTPSEAIVKAGTASTIAKDARGRSIHIRKLSVVDRMKMYEALGSDLVDNEKYFGTAVLAFLVTDIDDDPIVKPTSKKQLEILLGTLDDDGLDAIASKVSEIYPTADGTPFKDTVKNA